MNELKSIDNEYQKIKEQRYGEKKDLKSCYQHAQDIANLIKRINNISENVIQQKKHELIKIYEKEKKDIINEIINLSYESFNSEEEADKEPDYKSLIQNIQNSFFYEECKNKYKVKKMEIEYIWIEAQQKEDYPTAIEKLKEMDKIVAEHCLNEEIKKFKDECQKAIINKEKMEIKKLLEKQEFDEAIKQYQKLLNDENLFDFTYNEFLKALEYIIKLKIQNEAKEIHEIKIYKDFIIQNKNKIEYFKTHLKKINYLEKYNNNSKEEKEKELTNFNLIFNNKSHHHIERKNVDYYLEQIEKFVPEEEFEEFEQLKNFIYQQIKNFDNEEKDNYRYSKNWIENRKSYEKQIKDINNIGKIYSYFNWIYNQKTHFNIYTIQLISLLVLSQKLPRNIKGIFCKINTGEGKSTIIQFFAAYKVLTGHKVDIISSSSVLAERDAKEPKKLAFFEELKMTVGVVKTGANPYKLDIVYGDSTSFCADILQDEYEFNEMRRGRGFDTIIIDEVDNMCIDNLASKTQITKKFPGYQSLYTFYYTIVLSFNYIAEEMRLKNDPIEIEKVRKILKKSILHRLKDNDFDLQNGLKNELDVLSAVDKYLSQQNNSRNINKIDNESSGSTDSSSSKENKEENSPAKKLEKLLTQDGKLFEVNGKNIAGILYPNCLKKEIEENIEKWIDSVITAFTMVENIDYRIIKENNYLKIVPIDYGNTGVTQINMVWHDALHQMLQIINDIEVFPENLNTNFLYMITFFKKYKELYGLTGTIGSKTNQNTLKNLYHVNLFFIPPNLKSQLKKRTEVVFTDETQWENKIINEIKEIIDENRSILLICRSIKEGNYFKKLIKKNEIKNVKIYFTEENKETIEETLYPKQVIIATNLAGRGTDIKLTKELERSGGLHVIVSFLPINQRVEEQNYGRAGRNGQKGSYSLIFTYLANKNIPFLTVESIKKRRENDEEERFKNFKNVDEKNMKNEEELFQRYTKFRKILHDNGNQFIKEDNEYFWGKLLNSDLTFEEKQKKLEKLISNEKTIISPLMKIKYFLDQNNIDLFKKEDEKIFEQEKYYSWPLKMKYASKLAQDKKLELAKQYYEEVIDLLQDFQCDIQNQTVVHLIIFKGLTKNEKFNLKKQKTRIYLQNERKKKFLQAIIDIIYENIKIIENYDAMEEKEIGYIEGAEEKSIKDICKKMELDEDKNKDEIKDLTAFSLEFGVEKFEMLRIVTKPNFWKNYLVLGVGVIEVALCGVLCTAAFFTGQTKLVDLGILLVKQGFNDIVQSFKAAFDGKEIDLKKWGIQKFVDYTKGIIKIAIGGSSLSSIGEHFASVIKDEIIEVTKSYALQKVTEFAYNKLLVDGGSKIQEYCSTYIGKPILNRIIKKNKDKTRFFVMDLVNENDKLYKRYLVRETETLFRYFKESSKALKRLKSMFENVAKEKSMAWKAINIVLDSLIIFKDLYPSIKEIVQKKKGENRQFIFDTDGKYMRFDGSLKSLIKKKYQTYDENSRKKINHICEELIKYKVISKEGKFDLEQIENEDLDQVFFLNVDKEFQSVILSDKKFMESSNKLLDFDNQEKNNYINYIKEKSTYFGKRSIEYYKDEVCKELTKTVFENVKEIAVELIQILLKNLKGKIQQIGEKIQERKEKKEQERKKKEDEMLKASIIAYEQRNIQRNLEREKRIKERERKKKEKPINKTVKQNSNFPNKNDSNKIINPNPPTDSIKDTNTYPNLSTVKIEQKQKEIKKEEAKKEIQPVSNVSNSTSGSFCFSTEFSEGYDEEDQELIDRYESDKICQKLDEDSNKKNAQENKSSINIENKNQIHEEKSCLNPGNENFMETWKKDSNEVSEQIEKEDEEKEKKYSYYGILNDYYFPPSYYSNNISCISKMDEDDKKEDKSLFKTSDKNKDKKTKTQNQDKKDDKTDNNKESNTNKIIKGKNPNKNTDIVQISNGRKKINFNLDKSKIKRNLWKFGKMLIEKEELVNWGGNKILELIFGSDQKQNKNEDLDALNDNNINKFFNMRKTYKEKQKNKLIDEESKKEQQKKEGTNKWNNIKLKIIENEINDINYMYLIDEGINEIYMKFEQSLGEKIEKMFELKSFLLIKKKNTYYFNIIKDSIPQIKTLNLMMAGFTGSGKSCLINTLLKDELCKEGKGIYPETFEFKSYSNLEKVRGLTIYDTIGVECSNVEHNIERIKKMIKEKFDSNIQDQEKSLHGILYCISNGSSDLRIQKEEINYINELNKLYGNSGILTVVFTQTLDQVKTEQRKMELSEKLNDENVKIIDILAKDIILQVNNMKYEIKAYGLDILMKCLKEKCRDSLVKSNLKQIAKIKIKEKYLDDIKLKYKKLLRRIRKHLFEKSINDDFKYILENLIGDLKLDFQDLENEINEYIKDLTTTILEKLKKIYIDQIIEKIKEEFIILNAKYNNVLETNLQLLEILKIKFDKFFEPKIKAQLKVVILEKALLIFLAKIKNIISEKICENIEDKEIKELIDSNVNSILQKINC